MEKDESRLGLSRMYCLYDRERVERERIAMNMKPGTRYIVTKASDDGTFEVGDRIMLEDDSSVINQQAGGWLDSADVAEATQGMEVAIDHEWYARRRAELQAELARLSAEEAG